MKSKLKNIFLLYPKWLLLCVACCISFSAISQDVNSLLKKVKAKLDKVNDYTAEGRMKTDVPFIKAPAGNVKIFYKRPDKFKLKRSDGISLLPKGGLSANMGRLLDNGNYLAIAAGESVIGGVKLK